jgi:dinuclear metal center YbgI/SA1388 family protein
MTKISEVVHYLEKIAPPSLQEDYDNAGLIIGINNSEVRGILICLDVTEEVISEALKMKYNMIISHHPIIFRGLKKITGSNYVERAVITAIKNDIALYAIHTNLDNILTGVNKKIADKLDIINARVLQPKRSVLSKLISFIPGNHTLEVLDALHEAGAGIIGDYDHCSFRTTGVGRFRPNEFAHPHLGKKNEMEEVEEERIEVIFPDYLRNKIITALQKVHPYEEVAYYIQKIENVSGEIGSGLIGDLNEAIHTKEFLSYLKQKLNLNHAKYTPFEGTKIKKIAICGGSGAFLIPTAINMGADAFITADIKYHEYFDAEARMLIADVGHYESEVFTKELIYELLNKKFSNIALQLSEVNTNPVRYI